MNKFRFTLTALAIMAFTLMVSSAAQAQATRTWVSGVGDDANPCSRTAPCKTFAGAISKTANGGEISVLDPGGFGAVTITKAITISGDGTLAGILSAGTNGIVVNATANDVVIIRNVSINGAGTGINGIRFLAGKHLRVESCSIYGVTSQGIDVVHTGTGAGELTVDNTTFTNIGNVAVRVAATAGTPTASLTNVRIQRALIGFDVLQGTGTISNSRISNVTNQAVVVENSAVINATGCTLNNNGTGLSAFAAGSTINFANCDVFKNGTGLTVAAGATGNRFGNSRIFANTTDQNIAGTLNLQTNQ
jgi:hypothetical protein